MTQFSKPSTNQEEENKRLWRGFGNFVERATPWLMEIGIWIFGSLLAFTLLMLASLFTVGPVDTAIKAATAAFALGLPLNASGLLLLRMVRELKNAQIENELTKAFLEEGFTGGGQIPPPEVLEVMRQKRAGKTLRYAAGIMAASILLTLTGLVATLWHMAWWISIGFCLMIVLSLFISILAIADSQPSVPNEKVQKESDRNEASCGEEPDPTKVN